MRLKAIDHTNANRNLVNSPKRINTLQNSNVTTTTTTITTDTDHCDNDALLALTEAERIINNINGGRWSEEALSRTSNHLLIDNANVRTPEEDSLLLDDEEDARTSSSDDEVELDDDEVPSDASDSNSEDANNNSSDAIESGNRLDSVANIQKVFYDKPVVLNISQNIVGDFSEEVAREFELVASECGKLALSEDVTMPPPPPPPSKTTSIGAEEMKRKLSELCRQHAQHTDSNRFCKEDVSTEEKDEDSGVSNRKKEKINVNKRRSMPIGGHLKNKKTSPEMMGGFDVYNIETAMPKIDLEVIELHLRAAREEERRRRTDREEIRRRLAMGSEEEFYSDRPGRKPSLQARLQSGMNLQICFMNETLSDSESPSSDSECAVLGNRKAIEENSSKVAVRPATLPLGQPQHPPRLAESDFFAKQARLQTEARMALAQAKEMARMQMEIERQRQKQSPITEMVRHSMEKVGIPFPEDRRRLSRQILTEMNVAQLQVIVNDLHTQIEILNEDLVKFLMARDDLHMEQDSMLVDIEDLTRFLGAKEQMFREHTMNNNLSPMPPSPAPASPLSAMKPHFNRITSLVKK